MYAISIIRFAKTNIVDPIKTKAVKKTGSYSIKGTKIYITHGDQDMSENIIHMVLAKLPEAPPGNRGISLFLDPKYYRPGTGHTFDRFINNYIVKNRLKF